MLVAGTAAASAAIATAAAKRRRNFDVDDIRLTSLRSVAWRCDSSVGGSGHAALTAVQPRANGGGYGAGGGTAPYATAKPLAVSGDGTEIGPLP